MYELAFNNNGERFELPSTAEFWRPRRVRDRGLEVVYKKDGIVPLILSIDATADEFRAQVSNAPGKYRLDALDAHHQPLDGVPAAYVVIPRGEPAAQPASEASGPAATSGSAPEPGPARERGMSETAMLLSEVVRVNAEMTRTMAERFSSVMDAAAHLLRAADGAGLPARTPPEPRNSGAPTEPVDDEEDRDSEEDEDDERQMVDKIANVTRNVASAAQALSPIAMMLLGKAPLRNAGARTKEARPAAPERTGGARRPATAPPRATPVPVPAPAAAPAPELDTNDAPPDLDIDRVDVDTDDTTLTPEMMGHMAAIRMRLNPDEIAFLTEVYGELTPAEVARWLRELSALSVDEAIERIRAQIAGTRDEDDPDEPEGSLDGEEVTS